MRTLSKRTTVQTFCVLAGSAACNARCPFCISKMTPSKGVTPKEPKVNWKNFRKACAYAWQHGARTAIITGKGEPTLFPEQIAKYLKVMKSYGFERIELQTNGIEIAENRRKYARHLKDWFGEGLSLIAVSVVHYNPEKNRRIYLPHKKMYIDLPALIKYLHMEGRRFSVRLSCILLNGHIDSPKMLENLVAFAKENGVEQLTVRPVNSPKNPESISVHNWVGKSRLKPGQIKKMENYLKENGRMLARLPHGAAIYDVGGQNVCLTNSLTRDSPKGGYLRQLIFFPDGRLRTGWEDGAEVIL